MQFHKDGHTVETSLAREQVRLRAEGFVPVDDEPVFDASAPLIGGFQMVTNDTGEDEAVIPAPKPRPFYQD